ncbi:MAG: diflavin flavoprotein [Cyanobacteria bacterium P01_C01_bin.89]
MVMTTDRQVAVAPRLTMQTMDIAENTTAVRSLDWDRERFDIEFGLQNGTTYNSYVIKGDKIALVETTHPKFKQLYLEILAGIVDPAAIDYIILSHTEPDHSGLVKTLLDLAPNATVVASRVALQFLDNLIHCPYKKMPVKGGMTLDLGQGHVLEFINAPNLHWPDTMFTYDAKTKVLYTCDAFGMHYCSTEMFDEDLSKLDADFRFYYECLMAPNARSVLTALKRIDKLPGYDTLAVGHGPVLRFNVEELIRRYREWSQKRASAETLAVIFYCSNYGYATRMSQAIAHGIAKNASVAVGMVDLSVADPQEVNEMVSRASALVVGTYDQDDEQVEAAISTILSAAKGSGKNRQSIGIFESFGGNDEPSYTLQNKFLDLGLKRAFKVIRVMDTPSEPVYQTCEEAGTDLGQALTRKEKTKQIKSLDGNLDQAMGRLSGGLYIITAQKGDVSGAMLASWVAQASFEPLGLSIAVAKDRAIESLMQVNDTFVLNVLEEGNYNFLMTHFLKRFAPGQDRFEGIETQRAQNGSPILSDSLAFLECKVSRRMDVGDHWVVYSTVDEGRVAKDQGMTAVHHRKVGNHY